jgi:hypothetical protein
VNLFPDAYSGKILKVSVETDAELAELYPELDRQSEYRSCDAWLLGLESSNVRKLPKKRGMKRRLINWFQKSKNDLYRENRRAIELHRDSMVGANDWRETNGN